jgi:DNA-binding SARP family transcriptional activator
MLLVSIADAYSARGRHAQAVVCLEQINRHHPDNEVATRKLIAAYLDSGQAAKARDLQDSLASGRLRK